MPVYKRGARWHYRLQVGGQEFSGSAGSAGTRADAIALEAKVRADILAGRLGKAPSKTVDDAIRRWLAEDASRLKSYKTMLSVSRGTMQFTAGVPLARITDAAHALKAAGIQAGKAVATINRHLAMLRRVANLAHQWGWLTEPVGARIKLLPGEVKRHVYLTPAEVDHLADCCEHPRVADAIRLAARTGLRESELLRADTVHDDCIVVNAEHSKTGRPRLVPMPPDMPAATLPLGITYNTLRTYFERARIKADMPHVRIHDLRHTYASWMAQSGVTLTVLRDLLGHTSFAETTRYAHLYTGDLKAAVETMARRIKREI